MMKPTILQVEDEESDVYLLRHAFQEAGIANEVHVTRTGQDAINYFMGVGRYEDRKAFPVPAIVLLDLKLPVKSGLEVLKWIRNQPALKVVVIIVFTASCHPLEIERAYELGANCFVTKPANVNALVEFARHLKAWWLVYTQLAPMCEKMVPSTSPPLD